MGTHLEQLWEGTSQLKQDTRHTSLWVGNGVLWQGPAKGCHKAATSQDLYTTLALYLSRL